MSLGSRGFPEMQIGGVSRGDIAFVEGVDDERPVASVKDQMSDEKVTSIFCHSLGPPCHLKGPISDLKIPDLWRHPCLSSHASDVVSSDANFLPDSSVDVLTARGSRGGINFSRNQNDVEIGSAIDSLQGTVENPAIMILCVKLEAHEDATFNQTASISRSLVQKLFDHFDMHSGFLLDLVGRPNYWASVSHVKLHPTRQQEVFEFFCQHPRWHQKGRYDQKRNSAMQGNKAPCSVYMTYSAATNITLYVVAAPDDGIWFSFLERLRLGDNNDSSLLSSCELASSPFLVHALVANIAFEQATEYFADVRNRLMTQLKQVNDYSDSQSTGTGAPPNTESVDSRTTLQGITIRLHQVSQMLNTGLGGASSSIRLSRKLVQAHADFCRRSSRGKPGASIGRTHGMFQYVLDSFHYQQHWLEQYKTRKETAMNFVFNMVTQQDSSTNLDMAHKMATDSSSMHAITILTMVFLPGTFTATIFSSVAFRASESGAAETTTWLWPFIGVSVVLTLSVVMSWYFRRGFTLGRNAAIRLYKRRRSLKATDEEYVVGV